MEEHAVRIQSVEPVTHDVHRFRLERPPGYSFVPGQATEIAVNKPGWTDQRRPFTFTGLAEWDLLEFTIKIYNEHEGVTRELGRCRPGDELLLHDVWGAIQYKGTGVFIAGGAGITPFIAILRQLYHENSIANNQLFFSNKTADDIILRNELSQMLGANFHNTLTREQREGLGYGKIDRNFLAQHIRDFNQHFYICGPDQMVADVKADLYALGASESLVTVEL
ncbi:MAG TPA: flavodoxin reductase [Chitinophagaceae bacterium]